MLDQMHKVTEMDEIMKSNTSTEPSEMSTSSVLTESQPMKKNCSDCGTSKTPLWRGGPAGPKSLCNACGIRSRKRRHALLGLTNPEDKKINKSKKVTFTTSSRDENSCSTSEEISRDCGDEEKEKKMWCDDVRMEGLTWGRAGRKWRGVIGEEEQAAVLLMAMAYSSVLA